MYCKCQCANGSVRMDAALAPAEVFVVQDSFHLGDDLDDATPLIALRGKRSSDRAVAGVFADVTCIVALNLWICGFKDL